MNQPNMPQKKHSTYELVIITRPDIPTARNNEITNGIKIFITENNGEIIRNETWGIRNCSQPIKKYSKACYLFIALKVSYSTLKELERRIKLNDVIIRHSFIRNDEYENKPSPLVAEQKEESNRKYSPK